MNLPLFRILSVAILAITLAIGPSPSPTLRAQQEGLPELNAQDALGLQGIGEPDEKVTFEAEFTVDPSGKTGVLNVRADIIPGWHVFGMNKDTQRRPTTIRLQSDFKQVEIVGEFEPDADPHIVDDPYSDQNNYEFEFTVTWSAPITFGEGIDPKNLAIPIVVNGQTCQNGELGLCIDIRNRPVLARMVEQQTEFVGEIRHPNLHATIRGWFDPATVAAGEITNLNIQVEPDEGWHFFDLAIRPQPDINSTLIVLKKKNDSEILEPETADVDVTSDENVIRDRTTTWQIPIQLPRNIESESLQFSGWVGLQTAQESAEDAPEVIEFVGDVTISSQTEAGKAELTFSIPDDSEYATVASIAQREYEQSRESAGPLAGYSVPAVMGLAFLAGLILNVMPCVLPVIGLKIVSFVQQAGENPQRVLLLNLTFAAGILIVFLLLALLASSPQLLGIQNKVGWGGLYQSSTFTIVMVAVVFAFGLSFFGVWEIPIPGFAVSSGATKMAEREGYMGAFTKGILTTLLATPCSGPLLIPVVAWAVLQPPALTYVAFTALGIGMAFPYIVIGFKPSLVSFIPKPGPWMVTFKQLMGFLLMGTAVFFYNSIPDKLEIPVLTLLVFIGLGCWMIGNISLASSRPVRLRGWAQAIGVMLLGVFVSFYLLIPQNELEWESYSRQVLNEKIAEGKTVFVDFTADW